MTPTINSVLKDTKNFDVHEWKLKNGKTVWLTTEDMVEILSDYYNQEDYSWPSKIPDAAFLHKSNTTWESFYSRYNELYPFAITLMLIDLKLYPIFDNSTLFVFSICVYILIAEVFNILRKQRKPYILPIIFISFGAFMVFLILKKPI